MKILHIVSSLNRDAGGISEVVPRLCQELHKITGGVKIVTCHSREYSLAAERANASGVEIVHARLDQCRFGIAFSWDFKRHIEQAVDASDIIHIHGLWQAPGWIAGRRAHIHNKKYIVQPHGLLEPERLKISKWKKRVAGWLVERRNLSEAAALVATSESESEGFRKYGLNNRIHIMPIGIDVNKYRQRDVNGICLGRRRVLFFSRISPIKGLDMLAEAWARLKTFHGEWELLIVGPDDRGYLNRIKPYFEKLSPDGSVRFLQPVYGDEKYAILSSADIFVLPTKSENWSIAVAEAMASSVPVVCTKGAPWQCIEECGAGRWVDVSVCGIANGLGRLMSISDEERSAMGVNGRNWVEQNLNWGAIATNMVEFYKKILKG